MKKISSGAEAIIYLDKNKIIKHRISKSYRHPELDKKIIKQRTKAEIKILISASKIVSVPLPETKKEESKIIMPLIKGDKLSEKLDTYALEKQKKLMFNLGKETASLHKAGIIHGDLTTSNLIYKDKKIYFIDFGLGSLNGKYEDKGVDLHLLSQAIDAKHPKNSKKLFENFKKGYSSKDKEEAEKIFEKLEKIERRRRYKH